MWRLRNVPEVTRQQEVESGITHEPEVRAQTLSYYGALPLSVKTHPDALFTTTGNPRASHMHPMSQDLSVKDDQPNGMFCLKKKKNQQKLFPQQSPKPAKQSCKWSDAVCPTRQTWPCRLSSVSLPHSTVPSTTGPACRKFTLHLRKPRTAAFCTSP